jgi:TolB-like protein
VNPKNILTELKRRNVYRAAVAYGVVAWFLTQLTTQVFPFFEIPNSAVRFVVIALAAGFPIAMLLSWVYEFTPEGVVRTEDLDPEQARSVQRSAGRVLDFVIIGALLLIIAMLIVGRLPFYRQTGEPISQKSIAVLPFENLSADPENAFFTDGVQDEILNNLAKISELKVISRTSVMQYKSGVKRNVREIANALGVAHIVEGSVQRAAKRVRVSAQLIDAKTDTHLWAERYDRPMDDIFAIQNDIAKAIASQLRAKLSPKTKSAIEEPPTKDFAAYELYVRAKLAVTDPVPYGEKWLEAAQLLNQAIARDPDFFLAYCLLAETHSRLYFTFDHTAKQRDLAEGAVNAALRVRPEAGEAHLERARYLLRCNLDYDNARAELGIAQGVLPNNPQVFALLSDIDWFQGRWKVAVHNLEKALELDPANLFTLRLMALKYWQLRRFADAAAVLDRAIALYPRDSLPRVLRASWVDLDGRADPKPLREICEALMHENPTVAAEHGETWLYLALCERDRALAERVLVAIGEGYNENALQIPRALIEGYVARTFEGAAAARKAFTAARAEAEQTVRAQPDYGPPLCVLGVIDAGLGRKEEAIREGTRANELLPVGKDSINGVLIMQYLALIYAWTGEKDLAINQLAATLQVPSFLTYGELRLHPFWDSLRGDPRFEKLVEEAKKPIAPK